MMNILYISGPVNDAPNQVRYQRIKALSQRYELTVVTLKALPESLKSNVKAVHVVGRWFSLWVTCYRLAREMRKRRNVLVYTAYAPRLVACGFICRVLLGCRWIYDLYDHPSLTWAYKKGIRRLITRMLWKIGMSWMLRWADVWVIAMHPGILSHLPVPRPRTRLVLVPGPGVARKPEKLPGFKSADKEDTVICYAGPVKMKRGLDLVVSWAEHYEGPPATLHLMGEADEDVTTAIESIRLVAEKRGLQIVSHGWTPHEKVLNILKQGDIGICLLNPEVLNYRYAYPVKLVEYMTWGLVPVATDGQGVRALVRNGENGYVSKYSVGSFTRAMNAATSAMRSTNQRATLIRNAQSSVAGRDWKTINNRLLADLETALSTLE